MKGKESDNEEDNEVISEVVKQYNNGRLYDKWRKYKDDGLPDKEDLPLKDQKIDNILDNTPDNVTKRKSKDKRKTIQPIYQTPDGKIGDNQNETPALYETMDEKEIDGPGLKLNISSDKLHKNSLLDQIKSATLKKSEPDLKVEKTKSFMDQILSATLKKAEPALKVDKIKTKSESLVDEIKEIKLKKVEPIVKPVVVIPKITKESSLSSVISNAMKLIRSATKADSDNEDNDFV